MTAKKASKFIPSKRINASVLSQKLERLEKKLTQHQQEMRTIMENYDRHVQYLANFARHDMKNTVQSMDSILNTLTLEELTEENWSSLKSCLEEIRSTIENFSQLAPYSVSDPFPLKQLLVAVELLARPSLSSNNIKYEFNFQRKSKIEIHQPFQALLQVVNNLVINSIKSLDGVKEKHFSLSVLVDDHNCEIEVKDSGTVIEEDVAKRIFNYGYSTTGGTGIGLYHATYICNEINGTIKLNNVPEGLFTKKFIFKFPVKMEKA